MAVTFQIRPETPTQAWLLITQYTCGFPEFMFGKKLVIVLLANDDLVTLASKLLNFMNLLGAKNVVLINGKMLNNPCRTKVLCCAKSDAATSL